MIVGRFKIMRSGPKTVTVTLNKYRNWQKYKAIVKTDRL